MEIGKLPADTLNRLLQRVSKPDPDVLIGPALGEDAAAIKFCDKVLVAATDPITFATDHIGYYAVSVNANDIATHGAIPKYFLATILLPAGSSEADAEVVFNSIRDSCDRIGVTLIGGHTEITPAVDRVVVSGCMLGEVNETNLVRTAGAKPGDALILAGGIAIEGTSILARECADALLARGVSPDVINAARTLLDDPGICVLDYAKVAMQSGGITSMHDPTEGGLATALREMAAASGCGIVINRAAIPIISECEVICEALNLDPLGLIASGSLLAAVRSELASDLLTAFESKGISAGIIGVLTDESDKVVFEDDIDLPIFERDEIARYFDER